MRTGAGLVRKVNERVLAEETAWQRACKGEWVRPPGDAQLSERALRAFEQAGGQVKAMKSEGAVMGGGEMG